jgi:hypothetical protein
MKALCDQTHGEAASNATGLPIVCHASNRMGTVSPRLGMALLSTLLTVPKPTVSVNLTTDACWEGEFAYFEDISQQRRAPSPTIFIRLTWASTIPSQSLHESTLIPLSSGYVIAGAGVSVLGAGRCSDQQLPLIASAARTVWSQQVRAACRVTRKDKPPRQVELRLLSF